MVLAFWSTQSTRAPSETDVPACARAEIVRAGEVGTYHCVSRCVRRAFLCGEDALTGASFEHRRGWIRARLEELAGAFAVEVCGYSVMANHMHVILRIRPDVAEAWSPEELAARWWSIHPRRREPDGAPAAPTDEELREVLAARAGGAARVAELRQRLSSLSWFMARLAEPIARRANREDGCTGRFWEGRFRSHALLDEAAVLACSVYVDLNPIRAGLAATPEASDFTSAQDRIVSRQATRKLETLEERVDRSLTPPQAELAARAQAESRRADWLREIGGDAGHLQSLDLDGYLELLDWSGRQIARGKRGTIPAHLAPILERLQIEVDHWLETILSFGRWFRRAAGLPQRLAAEALRVGRSWLHGIGHARRVFGAT